jgi:hypothetical protein
MGPDEVRALIGQWVDLVGKDHDRDHDRDRDRHDGYGQQPYQQQPYQQPYPQQPYQPYPQQPYYPQQYPQQPYYPQQPPLPASAYRQPIAQHRATVYGATPSASQSTAARYAERAAQGLLEGAAQGLGPLGWAASRILGEVPEAASFPAPFPSPRAAVVDAPLPTQANRDILPMSTGVPILPTQSAQITGRPQTLVFKIGRFVISNAGTAGGAADWIVNDIKIGNRSQFVQSGDVPGDMFAVNAIDTFVRFEAAQTAMDVVVVVTYIGLNESGAPFFGAMVGTAAV